MESSDVDPRWKGLYKIAGVTCIALEVVILLGIVFFFIWPYAPGRLSTEEVFKLLHGDPFGGLVALDLLLLVGNTLSAILFLGLYVALKEGNESVALIALVSGLIAVILLVPDRPLLEMLSLSRQYAAAPSEVARSQIVAAGTSTLAVFDGTGWFMCNLLGGLSLLVSSILMLRNKVFTKPTAWVGIVSNVAVCSFFLPVVGTFLLFLSLLGYLVWYAQLAFRFFDMGRSP